MSVDADLAEAIYARWQASILLRASVPGGLQTDFLTGAQNDAGEFATKPQPYAALEITQERPPDHNSGGDRIEYLKATINVWGTGRRDLGQVVSGIRGVLETTSGWSIPSTTVMAIYPQPMATVKEEQTKSGEKILKATVALVFWLHRTAF